MHRESPCPLRSSLGKCLVGCLVPGQRLSSGLLRPPGTRRPPHLAGEGEGVGRLPLAETPSLPPGSQVQAQACGRWGGWRQRPWQGSHFLATFQTVAHLCHSWGPQGQVSRAKPTWLFHCTRWTCSQCKPSSQHPSLGFVSGGQWGKEGNSRARATQPHVALQGGHRVSPSMRM